MTDSVTAAEDQSARILSIADMLNTNDIQKSRRVLDKLDFMSTRFAVVKCGGDAGIADLSASPPDIMTKTAFNPHESPHFRFPDAASVAAMTYN